MKIKKLQIYNIASIAAIHDADEKNDKPQEILFEASPLSDSDVYLITGDTGAGKSTILDAICLALFNNTPRMQTKKGESVKTGIDTLTLKDTRRLMRRNTGEAYVKLFFTGIDGGEYVAEWHVQRGINKKASSQVGNVSRSLENLTKGGVVTSNNTRQEPELQEKIRAAIGLDFDQFCRTTMLAQNDFTRFLSSSEDERAEILEKITKTEKFAQAGMKIYEIITQKEKAWREAQEVAGNTGLSQEEIEGKKKEKTELESENETQKKAKEAAERKRNWLRDDDALSQKQAQAQKEYDAAKQVLEGNDFREKDLFVNQWNSTIEARNWLKSKDEAERQEKEASDAIIKLKEPFVAILNGQKFAADEADKDQKELDGIVASLNGESAREQMYGNAQTIAGHLLTMFEGVKKIREHENTVTAKEKDRDETLIPAKEKKEQACNSAQQVDEDLKKKIGEKQDELDALKLGELRDEKDRINDELVDLQQALAAIQTLGTVRQNWEKEDKRLNEAKTNLEAARKKLDEEIIPQYKATADKKEQCENVLYSLKDTVDKFAKQMRAKLTVGCECPVCRQKVENLPIEATLDSIYSKAQVDFEQAKNEFASAEQRKNAAESQYNTDKKRYEEDLAKHQGDNSVPEAEQKALALCQKCGIAQLADDIEEILKRAQQTKNDRLDAIKPDIKKGDVLDGELKKLRDRLQNHSQVEATRKALEKAQKDIEQCNGEIQTAKQLMAEIESAVVNAQKAAEPMLVETDWAIGWKENPDTFRQKLLSSAKAFADKKEQKRTLESKIETEKSAIAAVDDTIQKIRQQLPKWANVTETASAEMPQLSVKATAFLVEISEKKNSYYDATKRKSENEGLLKGFLDVHPEMSEERLRELNRTNSVAQLLKELGDVRSDEKTKKTLLEEAQGSCAKHQADKPEMAEGDAVDVLDKVVADAESLIGENNKKIGVLDKELSDDAILKAGLEVLQKKADEARHEYEKWNRLKPLSDKEGKNFRKIAQSLIFESLLESANYYLGKLEPRYTLKVVPGTLYSALEDAYQGFAERDTGSLSGGEGFLVSLALALALSEIGQGLEVDTLFIDEGFGSLSGNPLTNAINTLRSLRGQKGRHVGVISHIQEVRDNIPVQIQVNRTVDDSSSLIEVKELQ